MNLAKTINKKKPLSPYQEIAVEYDVCSEFVGKIARGERLATRGKGFLVKHALINYAEGKEWHKEYVENQVLN
ncbi:MAG: hypothetical protein ACK5L5_12360 [Bacteroidales bacterium]